MKIIKTGIGVTLMSILAFNFNGDNNAVAQDEDVSEDITVDEIIENGYEAQEDIETLYLETVIHVDYEGQEEESVTREWFKQDGDTVLSRTEIESPDGQITLMVNNGSEAISYTEGDDVAFQTDISSLSLEVDGESEPISQVFTVSAYLNSLQDVFDVSVEGIETVNEREAYLLLLEPNMESEGTLITTPTQMWVDTEYYIILRQQMNEDEVDSEMSSEFVEMIVNEEIDDTIFELELPDDVEIVDNMEEIDAPEEDADEDTE